MGGKGREGLMGRGGDGKGTVGRGGRSGKGREGRGGKGKRGGREEGRREREGGHNLSKIPGCGRALTLGAAYVAQSDDARWASRRRPHCNSVAQVDARSHGRTRPAS